MPNQPKTPHRMVRVDDDLWAAAKEAAADEGTTVSEVIRQGLREFVGASAASRGSRTREGVFRRSHREAAPHARPEM